MSKPGHHWIGCTPDPARYFGFIYRIDCLETGQSYIGKRQYWKAKPKAVKCKSKVTDKQSPRWKPTCWLPSDWQYYKGSSKVLAKFMEDHPNYTFTYTILCQCRSGGVLLYTEAQLQWEYNVLEEKLENGEYKFFNRAIHGIKFRPPTFCDDKTKAKISKALAGRSLSEEQKQKISDTLMGREFTEEHRKKLSEKAKGNTACKGRKLSKEQIEAVRKAHTGAKRSEESKSNMRKAQRKDSTIYMVEHTVTKELYTGTRYEVRDYCKMTADGINGLLRGRYKTSNKWKLKTEV